MCGASAESILLALATEKNKDENYVLKMYEGAKGRSWLENYLLGNKDQHIRNEMKSGLDLLNLWRDSAAHDKASNITDSEANILVLLKFAEISNSRWTELTG